MCVSLGRYMTRRPGVLGGLGPPDRESSLRDRVNLDAHELRLAEHHLSALVFARNGRLDFATAFAKAALLYPSAVDGGSAFANVLAIPLSVVRGSGTSCSWGLAGVSHQTAELKPDPLLSGTCLIRKRPTSRRLNPLAAGLSRPLHSAVL